jgi:hypothetical protein
MVVELAVLPATAMRSRRGGGYLVGVWFRLRAAGAIWRTPLAPAPRSPEKPEPLAALLRKMHRQLPDSPRPSAYR